MNKIEVINEQAKAPTETPPSGEQIRSMIVSLGNTVLVKKTKEEQKIAAAEELKKLSKMQLGALDAGFASSIDLPSSVREALGSIDIKELILKETNNRKNELLQKVLTGPRGQEAAAMHPSNHKKKEVEKTTENDGWIPHSTNPLDWNMKQIALASTVTVGVVGLIAWWKSRKSKKENPTVPQNAAPAQKMSWFRTLMWVPVIGLTAWLAVAGGKKLHGMLKGFDMYAKMSDSLQKKFDEKFGELATKTSEKVDSLTAQAKGLAQQGKDLLPFVGKSEAERKYGISEEQKGMAEKSYRKTRGKDLTEVRKVFGVETGKETPQYLAFLKDMDEQYKTREVNGILYARGDVAIANYERSMEVALKELGRWIGNNAAKFGIIGVILQQKDIISIQEIVSGSLSISVKSAKVAAILGQTSIKHPLISLFTVGSSFLAMKAAVAGSKHIELPENFNELGKAFSNNMQVVLGDAGPVLSKQVDNLKGAALELKDIGADFATWVTGSIVDFGAKALNASPEVIGLTKQEVMKIRHDKAFDDLGSWIENQLSEAEGSSKAIDEGKITKCEMALQELYAFRDSLFAERLEIVTTSDEPQKLFEKLKATLKDIGAELELTDGIVRWKINGKELTDLCVDPSLKNESSLYEHSNKMRQGEEDGFEYTFFRTIQHLREKEQGALDKGEKWADNKVVAMVVGNVLYITNPDNREEFWTAPVSVAYQALGVGADAVGALAFGQEFDWKNLGDVSANMSEAATNAALISLSAGTLARVKRLFVGGSSLAPNVFKRHTWFSTFGAINPMTSPFKLVKDVARGVIDFETFARLGHYGASGGWYVNSLLASAHVRPEWIGIVDDATSTMNDLRHIATELGANQLPNNISKARQALRINIRNKLREAKARDLPHLKFRKMNVLNYSDVRRRVNTWYQKRSIISRGAGRVSNAVEHLAEPIELGYKALSAMLNKKNILALCTRLKIAPAALMSALKAANFSPALLSLLTQTSSGVSILVSTFAKGGSAGLNYLAKLGNLAPAAKLLARPAGAIGLGTFFYLMEKSVIDEQIKNTDSRELKELYEARKNAEAAFAIGTTGSALALRYGGRALSGVLLPVTIAAEVTYFVANPIRRSFEEATIEWMKSDKDMLRDTPCQSLAKLSEIDVGKQRYLQDQNAARGDSIFGGSLLEQVTGLGNGQARYEQVERTNTGQRAKITRAYLANTSEITTGDKEKIARSLMAQEQYIASATDNTFGTVNTEGYYNAQDHAELKEVSRTLQESGESGYLHLLSLNGLGQIEQGDEFDLREYNDLPPKGGNAKGISRGKVLLSYRQQKRAMALASSFMVGEMKTGSASVDREQEAILAHRMITDIRHDLSRADARVQSAEIDRWEWTGGKEETRGRMRFALSTELKKMLAEESKTLRTHPNAGLPEINASIAKLQLFLAQDMAVFAKLAERPDVVSGFTAFSASEKPGTALTDWRVLMQELNPPAGTTNAPTGLAA